MRKSFWIILPILLLAGAGPVRADIITGTLNFTLVDGTIAPTGSFVLNNTTGVFQSFTVNWNGTAFDFTVFTPLALDDLISGTGKWCGLGPNGVSAQGACNPDPSVEFALTSPSGAVAHLVSGGSPTSTTGATADGTYTVTETVATTPEPGTGGLVLLGSGGLLLFMRKRIARGL